MPSDAKHFHFGKAIAAAVWVVLAFYAVQLVLTGVILGLDGFGVSFEDVNQSVLGAVLAAVVYAITLGVVIGVPWLVMRDKVSRKELGVHRPLAWRDLLLSVPAYLLYFLLTAVAAYVVITYIPAIDMEQAQDVIFNGIGRNYEFILAFITLVILAPVAEEVLFRGYLFGRLMRYIPVWLAVLVTSAIFAAEHGQWNVAVDTFILSVVMCAVRLHTGTIWTPIMIHMIKNGIAFYLLFVNPSLLSGIAG